MRYKIMFQGNVVAESEYRDLAEAAARNSPVPVTLLDLWTGETIPVAPKPVRSVKLPESYIKQTLTQYYMQGGQSPKIPLIKLVRELTGMGLGEAKEYIDRLDAEENLRARREDSLDN